MTKRRNNLSCSSKSGRRAYKHMIQRERERPNRKKRTTESGNPQNLNLFVAMIVGGSLLVASVIAYCTYHACFPSGSTDLSNQNDFR